MKKMSVRTIIPVVTLSVLVACGTSDTQEGSAKVTKHEKKTDGEQLPKVTADRLLVVELEGMVCKMGCGGEIRKDLYASEAVESVSFDFDEENPVDVARVAYDRDKITAEQIVEIISKTNDGQFKVKGTKSEAYVSPEIQSSASSDEASNSKSSKVNVKTSVSTDVPDIFDIFSFVL